MKTFGIIGAGHVGTTLALLLVRNGLTLRSIYSRSETSAQKLQQTVGSGTVIRHVKDQPPVDFLIITTNDTALRNIAQDIADVANLSVKVAFHCSGSLPSDCLAPLRQKGGAIASVHPVKSFTNPEKDAASFPGTWCGMEGDVEALNILAPLFTQLGANVFQIDGAKKAIYHAGNVFACNYLAPLIEAGLQCYESAGLSRETAMMILNPILHATIDNIAAQGTAKALTGPIARGDTGTIENHQHALQAQLPHYRELYDLMGRLALPLALEKGTISQDVADTLADLLTAPPTN